MDLVWEGLDAFGWVNVPFFRDHRDEEAHRREAEVSRPYVECFGVPESVNLAFRDLVATCRENKIGVALLLTPEASRIRSLYTAQSLKSRNDYLRRFAQPNGCGVIECDRLGARRRVRRGLPHDPRRGDYLHEALPTRGAASARPHRSGVDCGSRGRSGGRAGIADRREHPRIQRPADAVTLRIRGLSHRNQRMWLHVRAT